MSAVVTGSKNIGGGKAGKNVQGIRAVQSFGGQGKGIQQATVRDSFWVCELGSYTVLTLKFRLRSMWPTAQRNFNGSRTQNHVFYVI